MRSVEAEGESIDAAIEQALAELNTTRDRVDIEILSNASRGLFGLGGRRARVRATLREPISESILGEVDAYPATPATSPAPAKPEKSPARSPAAPTREEHPPPQQRSALTTPPDEATRRRAQQVLRDIVGHIGVTAQVTASVAEDGTLWLQLTGDHSGVLIGRKGQMLDALEYLVGRIVSRDRTRSVRVVIDCERYRERRRESLQQLARRMSEEAKRKRRVVKLNPMSARDRRVVHLALQQEPGITTRSSGKGEFRRLVIIPDGASKSTAD